VTVLQRLVCLGLRIIAAVQFARMAVGTSKGIVVIASVLDVRGGQLVLVAAATPHVPSSITCRLLQLFAEA
jgi:hypothetical protein